MIWGAFNTGGALDGKRTAFGACSDEHEEIVHAQVLAVGYYEITEPTKRLEP